MLGRQTPGLRSGVTPVDCRGVGHEVGEGALSFRGDHIGHCALGPGRRFDSTGAGSWLCPMGAPMAKQHPPGGEGLSHSPADEGGNCPSKATLLPSPSAVGRRVRSVPRITSGSQKTGCANRNLHVWTTGKAPRSRPWEGMARHPVGGGRWGAHRGNGASPPVRSAENLSRRQAECAGASLPKYISHNKAVRLDFQGKTMTARA